MRILVMSFDYRPMFGGIATCAFELSSALSKMSNVNLRLLSASRKDDVTFDQHGLFETKRATLSSKAEIAVWQWAHSVQDEIADFKPDVILQFLWYPDAATYELSQVFQSSSRIPNFIMVHGVEILESTSSAKKIIRKYLSPIKKNILQKATSLFAVSHYTADLLKTHCQINPDKIKVVLNAVNSEHLNPGVKSKLIVKENKLENKFVFFTLTRLVDYKGIDYTLQALSELRQINSNFKYLIAGTGPDAERLHNMTKKLNLEEHVQFLGSIPFSELQDYYRTADCFIMLSREDLKTPNVEGFGLVYLEAAACEIPSIGARAGGVPDAIEDKKTGWLVNPTDTDEIKLVLLEALQNPEKTKKMGKNARARVQNEFQWKHMANKIFDEMSKHVRN